MKPGVVFGDLTSKTKHGFVVLSCLLALCPASAAPAAQGPASARNDAQRSIDERIRALQQESEELARQSQTLVGDLRKLEIERDLRRHEATQAEAASAEAQR